MEERWLVSIAPKKSDSGIYLSKIELFILRELYVYLTPNFWGRPFWSFLEMAGSRPDRPLRTPGLLLRPVISLGDLL